MDIVHVAVRQVPIITAVKDFQDGKYNFMDCELVLSVSVAIVESGALRGNFIVDSQITILELKKQLPREDSCPAWCRLHAWYATRTSLRLHLAV